MPELHTRAVDAVKARVLASPAVTLLTGDGSCSVEVTRGKAWPGERLGFTQRDAKVVMTARTRDELLALADAVVAALIHDPFPPAGGSGKAVLTDTSVPAGDDAAGWSRTYTFGIYLAAPKTDAPADVLARARAAKKAADKVAAGGETIPAPEDD